MLTSVPDSNAYRITGTKLRSAYIVENEALESILFNRNLVGQPFTEACRQASARFLCHLTDEFEAIDFDLAELMLLSKGFYYFLHQSYLNEFNRNLEINFVATQRANVSDFGVEVQVPYSHFAAPKHTLIIGDTLASGESLIAGLTAYLREFELNRIFVLTIAGSRIGGERVQEFVDLHGIKMTLLYGLAAFGLGDNGFDLPFLHDDTISDRRYKEWAKEYYRGLPISAAGWDFGSQSQSIAKYRALCWLENERWELGENSLFENMPDRIDQRLVRRESSALQDLEDAILDRNPDNLDHD